MEILKDLEHHRCRDRIRDYGEVFTPEAFVYDLLNQLGGLRSKVWSDEKVVFFEPSCGHGNFCDAILERRLEAFYKKAKKRGEKQPALYAVAYSLNNLWAIDIDAENVEITRQRLFIRTILFIESKTDSTRNFLKSFFDSNSDYIAHLICTLKWQIRENEALSALGSESNAKKTRLGESWIRRNKHEHLDFELSWVEYYKSLVSQNVKVSEYESVIKQVGRKSFKNLKFVREALVHLQSLKEAS